MARFGVWGGGRCCRGKQDPATPTFTHAGFCHRPIRRQPADLDPGASPAPPILRRSRNTAAAVPKKPRGGSRARHGTGIPKGDALLPGVDTDVLREMHAELSGRRDVRKEALIVAAAIKWEGLNVSEIVRQLLQPRSAVRDRLVRLRDRGLEGIPDRAAPNRRPILGDVACLVVGVWLPHAPRAYGLVGPVADVHGAQDDAGPAGNGHQARNAEGDAVRDGPLRTLREVPRKSADHETCKKFVKATQKMMDALAKAGHTIFYEDEMTMLLAAQTGRGSLPRGGRETIKTTFSRRSVEVFLRPGQGGAAPDAGRLDQIRGVQGLSGGAPPTI